MIDSEKLKEGKEYYEMMDALLGSEVVNESFIQSLREHECLDCDKQKDCVNWNIALERDLIKYI